MILKAWSWNLRSWVGKQKQKAKSCPKRSHCHRNSVHGKKQRKHGTVPGSHQHGQHLVLIYIVKVFPNNIFFLCVDSYSLWPRILKLSQTIKGHKKGEFSVLIPSGPQRFGPCRLGHLSIFLFKVCQAMHGSICLPFKNCLVSPLQHIATSNCSPLSEGTPFPLEIKD